jgi:CBS domain-containing protein
VGSGGARRVVVIHTAKSRRVVGIITDADLVGRVGTPARHGLLDMLREGLSLLGSSAQPPLAATSPGMARDVMTQPVVTAPLEMPIPAAIDLMLSREVKVLPVVDAEGRLLGIANRARLLQALLPPGVASA